jgi:Putative peptidoglycan binding domain/N-acetylmuramoyl-L-alanine amidase
MLQWLTKAGDFTVEPIGGIPHFAQSVLADSPRAGVLHTTEGSTIEGAMSVFKTHFAPHFALGKSASGRVVVYQLVPIGFIGAALVTHNDLAIVQVEMVGFSKETAWFPDDETAAALAGLMAACRDEYGIPLWRPWADGVYGMATASDPHRNAGQFGKDAGWFGHGDVPAPDSHWDPGAFQWSRVFALAANIARNAPTPDPVEPPRPCAPSAELTAAASLKVAVEDFQRAAGLTVDGDPGPETRAAFEKALAA